jgi:hypothetical protein
MKSNMEDVASNLESLVRKLSLYALNFVTNCGVMVLRIIESFRSSKSAHHQCSIVYSASVRQMERKQMSAGIRILLLLV